MSPANRVFVAFAGGGAKALIHVGALAALEERKVTFKGLAGTSAGAMVAALKAAGFTAADLIDPDNGTTILGSLQEIQPEIAKISDIFGNGGWARVAALRYVLAHPLRVILPVSGMLVFGAGAIGTLLMSGSWSGAVAVALILGVPSVCAFNRIKSGLTRLTLLREAFSTLLQRKMFPDEPGREVLMRDFGDGGYPTLRIVSANLSSRRLHLFSPERTPDVAVADAVAASISLPVVFEPARVGSDLHMDGGIVSNLPAWPFDEERELDGEATTIAVEIESASGSEDVSAGKWIRAFVETALFGAGELNLRAAGRAELIGLRSSLGLLDFDLTLERACQEVRDARQAAATELDDRLFTVPELYRDACRIAQVFVDDTLEDFKLAKPSVTRVAVAIPDAGYHHSLRLRYSVGYELNNDEGMLVPIDGSVAGAVWRSGLARFEVAPLPAAVDLPGEEHRRRRKARRPDLAWVFCIPIFVGKSTRPAFVVVIDGDEDLPRTEAMSDAITSIEEQVTEVFKLVTSKMGVPEKGNGLDE